VCGSCDCVSKKDVTMILCTNIYDLKCMMLGLRSSTGLIFCLRDTGNTWRPFQLQELERDVLPKSSGRRQSFYQTSYRVSERPVPQGQGCRSSNSGPSERSRFHKPHTVEIHPRKGKTVLRYLYPRVPHPPVQPINSWKYSEKIVSVLNTHGRFHVALH
jgi:hypothetical protein